MMLEALGWKADLVDQALYGFLDIGRGASEIESKGDVFSCTVNEYINT